jgi:hypothetical protein
VACRRAITSGDTQARHQMRWLQTLRVLLPALATRFEPCQRLAAFAMLRHATPVARRCTAIGRSGKPLGGVTQRSNALRRNMPRSAPTDVFVLDFDGVLVDSEPEVGCRIQKGRSLVWSRAGHWCRYLRLGTQQPPHIGQTYSKACRWKRRRS